MSTRIPLPGAPGQALGQGLDRGSQMFARLMAGKLQQQQLQQAQMQQMQNYALKQQEEQRAQALHPFMIRKQEMEELQNPLKQDLIKAKIARENAQALLATKGGTKRPSAAIQEAEALYGDLNDPRAKQYILDRNKIINGQEYRPELNNKEIPEGAISLNLFTPAQRKAETDRQNKFIDQGESWKHIMHQLDEADKILDENPNLSDSFASIIEEAGGKSKGYLNPLLNRMSNEKDRTAVQKLDKIYSDIVLNLDSAMPGRGSVFKLQTINSAKGRSKNTNQANKFINNSLRKEGTPFVNYAKDLKKIKGRYSLDFDRDKYSNIEERDEMPDISKSTYEKMLKGQDAEGNLYDIKPEDEDDFVKAGGKIL